MGAEIDRLEVQVEAQAARANSQLDKLVGKLNTVASSLSHLNSNGLTGLSNGVAKFAQASAQLSSVKTVDFTRLTKNIEKLSALNTQQIYGSASAMTTMKKAMNDLGSVSANSMQIAQIAKDISKLGGKNVQTAITNLPQLATELKNLMQTMATAPQVSQNVIQMTNAMAKLASQGSKVSSATNALQTNAGRTSSIFTGLYQSLKRVSDRITIFGNKVQKADKKTKNFSSTIGSLYQKIFFLKRGFDSIWGSIESSMSHLEVLNYFDAAFGQVAENAVGQWKSAGYDSAEAYYNSFSSRAKQLTAKMSGYVLTDKGMLEATGMPSLGINPSTLMNYQAMFGQMSSSMGVTSETALKLSDALSMIGADLASVKNMDFEKVWNDMASGLAGMSRTLDKYGVNIRNVNLQQRLNELGIKANIAELNQNDKALLRTIILLDSTRYAWGDLADTLGAPANQLRLLTANIQNLARTIGSIFLPIVAKVLPYINGLVIALQRLFSWIAKLLGVDLSAISSSVGSGGDGIGDLIGDTDDLTSGLDDAASSAKKLKNQLQGFDSLNVITTSNDAGVNLDTGSIGGLLDDAFLDAFSEYQKAWDDAFSRLENKAEEIADKIEAFAKKLFTPIKKAWDKAGGYVTKAWAKALKEIGKLVASIGSDMMEIWQQQETIDILTDILYIIGDIGYTIGYISERFRAAWESGDTGLHILENIRDIIGAVVDNIADASLKTMLWANSLNFEPLLDKIEEWTESLIPVFENLSGILTDFYTQVLLPLGKWTIEKGLPDLLQVFIDFNNKVDWEALRSRLSEFWDHLEPFTETVGEGLIIFIDRVSDALADFVNSEAFDDFLTSIGNWMDNVEPEDISNGLEKLATVLIALKGGLAVWDTLKNPIKLFGSFVTIISNARLAKAIKNLGGASSGVSTISKLGGALKSLGGLGGLFTMDLATVFGAGTATEIGLTIGTGIIGGIVAAFGGFHLGKFIGGKITGDSELYDNFKWIGEGGFFDSLFGNVGEADGVIGKLKEIGASAEEIQSAFGEMATDWSNPFIAALTNIIYPAASVRGVLEDIVNSAKEFFNIENWKEMFSNVKQGAEEGWSEFTEWWSDTGIPKWWDENVAPWFTEERWSELWENIKTAAMNKWQEIVEWWQNTAIYSWWEEDVKPFFSVESWSELWDNIEIAFSEAWDSIVEWWNGSAIGKWFNDNVKPWFTKEKWVNAMSGVKTAFSEVWNNAISSIKEIWNEFATWLNSKLTWTIPPINIAGQTIFSGTTLDLGNIPTFSVGGFPEDGLFLANHSELVGQFSNGKTAVANNEQITDGIAIAVQNANSEQNALLREQNQLLRAILEKDGMDAGTAFRMMQSQYTERANRMGVYKDPVWEG